MTLLIAPGHRLIDNEGVRLVLVGPPGCGKGTQAALLSERFGVPRISSGDLLRSHAATLAGALVPDQEVVGLVAARLADPDASAGFVLDGFPRTLAQAQALDALLDVDSRAVDAVLEFHVPTDEIVRRISGRRTCRSCGRVWHVSFNPPPNGRCGACGADVYQRADDEPATIARRLEVYAEQTLPVVAYYRARGLAATIDGTGSVDAVLARASAALAPTR